MTDRRGLDIFPDPTEWLTVNQAAKLAGESARRIGRRSAKLVKTGKVDLTPGLICGSQENLTIHHVEPIQADRFVFLCEPCHVLAHKPVFRTMEVCVASGHFSIRPDALLPKKEVRCG